MCNYGFCFEIYVNMTVFVAWFDFSILGYMHNLKQNRRQKVFNRGGFGFVQGGLTLKN